MRLTWEINREWHARQTCEVEYVRTFTNFLENLCQSCGVGDICLIESSLGWNILFLAIREVVYDVNFVANLDQSI